MKKKPDIAPAWLAVEEAVMGHKFTGDPEADAFQLCRIAHGLMGQHDVNPFDIQPLRAARRVDAILLDHHPGIRGVAEHVEMAWRSVLVPEGWDAVQWAVKRAGWMKRPKPVKGRYASREQHRLATTLWHIFRLLPKDAEGQSYASCRKLAHYLDTSHTTIAATLKKMETAGIITRNRLNSTCYADRFTLQMSY